MSDQPTHRIKRVAVIAKTAKGFQGFVKECYDKLPPDKSIQVLNYGVISVTYQNETTLYSIASDIEDMSGLSLDAVEKADDFFLIEDVERLYQAALSRVKIQDQ